LSSSVPGISNSILLCEQRRSALSIPTEDKNGGWEDSDERLMALVCNGDRDALGSLYRRYARLVRNIAYKVLRDAFEADDLVNEIFLLVHRKGAAFDSSKGSARSWILQVTYHRALSRRRYLSCRHFYNRVDLDDAEAQVSEPQFDDAILKEAIDIKLGRSELQRLMARLSENQQKTLRLYFFEGYTLEEIAAQLGQNTGNIKHHYFRGLEKLRKQAFRDPSPVMTTLMRFFRGS
jgi:RNA polymerase sigma-70 factor (ECF subfamily)